MSRVYLIKPLEKKSICWHIEMFRENADGSISWVNIDDHYRWGQGFVEYDADVNLPIEGDLQAHAKTEFGWGAELDDGVACYFEYSDDFTDEEKEAFESSYHEGGAAWLFDGDHSWQVEDDYLIIDAPYQVSLCEEDGTVVEENVKLKTREQLKKEVEEWKQKMPKWPFESDEEHAKKNGLEL